jgi:ABC-type lipoprotein export system ATPase subunit
MALLERLNHQGMTILMVTHDPQLGSHADRIIHLKDGRVLKAEEVKDRRRAEEELAMLQVVDES